MRRAIALASLSAITCGLFVACGDDGGGAPDGSTTTDSAVSDGEAGDGAIDADTSPSDSTAPMDTAAVDTGPPDDGRIGAFLLQGHAGRTVLSCDDGRTWVADQSLDDSISCFSGGFDCDHHPGAAKGVTYGGGYFWATFGWGMPGGVSRSADGVVWEEMLSGTTFGGIAHGAGRVMATSRRPQWSSDDGATWNEEDATIISVWNVRRGGFADHAGGRFVMVGSDSAERDVIVSDDGGATWARPGTLPAECGDGVQTRGGIVYGNGAIVIVGSDGTSCVSTDGGTTFTAHTVADGLESQVVFDGASFRVWGAGMVYDSTDGRTWAATATTPSDLAIGPVAVSSETGTLVAADGRWMQWYDDQDFWRSTDGGVTWETLGSGTYGGHPARFIAYGRVVPSAECPAP